MTNKTEMPVEIFTPPLQKIQSTESEIWDKKPIWNDSVPYTRTDTIPSKAEVAREFVDAAYHLSTKTAQVNYPGKKLTLRESLIEVLKEWEDEQ